MTPERSNDSAAKLQRLKGANDTQRVNDGVAKLQRLKGANDGKAKSRDHREQMTPEGQMTAQPNDSD